MQQQDVLALREIQHSAVHAPERLASTAGRCTAGEFALRMLIQTLAQNRRTRRLQHQRRLNRQFLAIANTPDAISSC
jgi:hypothetical protein